ncbi:MAG: flavodoxin domain-containing protein, partial [Bacillota bacterium]
ENLGWYIDKYKKWGAYEPEEQGVVIPYGSIYGNTANAAELLAVMLADRGVRNIRVYDVGETHISYILSELFRYSHVVFASMTYNNGLFPPMENLVLAVRSHNLQNRTVAFIENGTWVPQSGKLMREIVSPLKGMTTLDASLTISSSLKPGQEEALAALADAVKASM